MATDITLSDELAVYGQSLLAVYGQILLAAHRGLFRYPEEAADHAQTTIAVVYHGHREAGGRLRAIPG